jgi:predicted nucleic acid-binding protein
MNLAIIGLLDLLREFFSEIYITQAVWREVVVEGEGKEGVAEVKSATWIKVVDVKETALLQLLKKDLDDGEAETIAYALQKKNVLILIDEEDAREIADFYKIKKTGVIGILIRAKLEDKIPSLKSALNDLRNKAGFWIKDSLYQEALKAVGEL